MIDNNLSHGQISLGVNDLPVSMIIPGKLDGEQPVRHSQIIKLNQESEVGSQNNVADEPKPRDSIISFINCSILYLIKLFIEPFTFV